MPPIVVTGRDERITSRHKKHVQEKVGKLKRYFDGIVKIEAILSYTASNQAKAELLMSVRGGGKPLVCQSRSKELYAAVDLVMDKAEAQLTRHKEKLKGHKGIGVKNAAPHVPTGIVDETEEEYQEIVRKRAEL